MSIRIVVSPLVRFKVEGKETAEDGSDVPFDFFLTAERLATSEEVIALRQDVRDREIAGDKTPIVSALLPKVRDWAGPLAEDGKPAAFTQDNCRDLLNRPGMAALAFHAYIAAVGVKEKNS